ncbi:MAG: acyltransferase [Betaproteobacteria bacterium]|nr:MAG: acyltransferase [Betaproteobacteria bacterium]
MTPKSHRAVQMEGRMSAPSLQKPARMAFANQLRAVAALMVVWLHLGVHYWTGAGFAAATLGFSAAPAQTHVPFWASLSHVFGSATRVDFGALGVAVFFLISGFVIPLSLRDLKPARFLLARAIRIFPTYIACFSLLLLAWWLVRTMGWGPGRPEVSLRDILAQAFLVGDVFATAPLDLVSWTLQIEIKFYLLSALIATSLVSGTLTGVYVLAVLALLASGLHRWAAFNEALTASIGANAPFVFKQLFVQAGFVIYIFCGYVFLLYYEARITLTKAAVHIAALFLLSIAIEWLCEVPTGVLKSVAWNQLLAIGVFYAALRWCPKFGNARALDFLARISFPLYLVHLTIGWGSLVLLRHVGVNSALSLLAALALSLLFAWLLHLTVEVPSMRLNEWMKRKDAGATRSAP